MILRVLVVLALLIQPVQAEQWVVKKPPAWADHEPTRPYTIEFKSQKQVNQMCEEVVVKARKNDPSANALGCSNIIERKIWIVKGLSKRIQQQVIRHEKAHMNGWFHR